MTDHALKFERRLSVSKTAQFITSTEAGQNHQPVRQRPRMRLITFLVYCITVLQFAAMIIFLAEIVLIGLGHVDLIQSTPFYIANRIGADILLLGAPFAVMFAPSLVIVVTTFTISAMNGVLLSVCLYFQYNWIPCAFAAIGSVVISITALQSKAFFEVFASLPIEAKTLDSWSTSLRLYFIIVLPVLAWYVRADIASPLSWCAISVLSTLIGFMHCFVRITFYHKPNATNILGALQQTPLHHLVGYVPIVGMLVIFTALYILLLAEIGQNSTTSSIISDTGLAIAMGAFLFVYLMYFVIVIATLTSKLKKAGLTRSAPESEAASPLQLSSRLNSVDFY